MWEIHIGLVAQNSREPIGNHIRGDMIQTYKTITRVYARDVTTGLFNLRKDSTTRGWRYKIFKEQPRLEVRKHSFFFSD